MLHRLRSFAVQCPKGRVTAEGSHRKAEYLLDGSEHADAGAGQGAGAAAGRDQREQAVRHKAERAENTSLLLQRRYDKHSSY